MPDRHEEGSSGRRQAPAALHLACEEEELAMR